DHAVRDEAPERVADLVRSARPIRVVPERDSVDGPEEEEAQEAEVDARMQPAGARGLVEQSGPERLVAVAQLDHLFAGRTLERPPFEEHDLCRGTREQVAQARAQGEAQP